jgi:hypothetical protein
VCDSVCDGPDIRQAGNHGALGRITEAHTAPSRCWCRRDIKWFTRVRIDIKIDHFLRNAPKSATIFVGQCLSIQDFLSDWVSKTACESMSWHVYGHELEPRWFVKPLTSTTDSRPRTQRRDYGQVYEYKLADC